MFYDLKKLAYIFRKASGSTILYHITNSADVFPKPLDSSYFQRKQFRSWMKDAPEKAIWLSPNWFEVFQNHGLIRKNVFVFEVDNGLIEEAGGIHTFDDAPEIIINEELWNKGINSGKIIPKGKLSEHKIEEMLKLMKPRDTSLPIPDSAVTKIIRREIQRSSSPDYRNKLYDLLEKEKIYGAEKTEEDFFRLKSEYEKSKPSAENKSEEYRYVLLKPTEEDKRDIKKIIDKLKLIRNKLYNSLIKEKVLYIRKTETLMSEINNFSDLILQDIKEDGIAHNNIREKIAEYKGKVGQLAVEVAKALEEDTLFKIK
jgi:hypothetical protein